MGEPCEYAEELFVFKEKQCLCDIQRFGQMYELYSLVHYLKTNLHILLVWVAEGQRDPENPKYLNVLPSKKYHAQWSIL